MARLDYGGDVLWLHLSLLERYGASVRQDLAIPLTAVRSVRVTDDPWPELRGERFPGTTIGGVVALGTRRHSLGRDFVAVRGKGPAVVIELTGVRFLRLVVSSHDAAGVADEINGAVAEPRN